MQSRWTKIGNLPKVSYILKNGGNQLDIQYMDFATVRSIIWVSITNPPEALINLCTKDGCCNVVNDANNPRSKTLVLNKFGQQDPASINYFIAAIDAYYPLDEELKQSITAWANKLAEKNKGIPMSVYDLCGAPTYFKPDSDYSQNQKWEELGFRLSMMNYSGNAWK